MVELEFYDPQTDLPSSPIAPEKDGEGKVFGRIHQTSGNVDVLPGWAYWQIIEIDGQPVTGAPWEAGPPEKVAEYFEPLTDLGDDDLHDASDTKRLPASNLEDGADAFSSKKKGKH